MVKGTDIPTPTVLESFNVLVKELQALGISVNAVGAGVAVDDIVADAPAVRASTPADDTTTASDDDEEKTEEQAKELEKELGGEEVVSPEDVKDATIGNQEE